MTIREVGPAEARELLQEGWTLIDVRTPGEWAAAHIAGAIHLPLDRINPSEVDKITGGQKKLLMICRVGARSIRACELLLSDTDVETASVAGGILSWAQMGFPVEHGT